MSTVTYIKEHFEPVRNMVEESNQQSDHAKRDIQKAHISTLLRTVNDRKSDSFTASRSRRTTMGCGPRLGCCGHGQHATLLSACGHRRSSQFRRSVSVVISVHLDQLSGKRIHDEIGDLSALIGLMTSSARCIRLDPATRLPGRCLAARTVHSAASFRTQTRGTRRHHTPMAAPPPPPKGSFACIHPSTST